MYVNKTTAPLESLSFDPIKSGRQVIREQSLQDLRKRLKLGLPLQNILPETRYNYVYSPSHNNPSISDRLHYQGFIK